MKNKLLLLVMQIFITTVLISSCNKTLPATSQTNILKSYYSISPNNVDGTFLFQSQINNDPSIKNLAQIIGLFYDKTGNLLGGGGSVFIGDYNVPDSDMQYTLRSINTDSLFGTDLTFNITPPPNTAAAPVTTTFYSPAAIFITNNTPVAQQINLQADSSLLVTWNADSQNSNGVNIDAECNLDSAAIENSIMVSDDGSTVLPASFFSKFPKNKTIFLYVGRGNAIIVQSGNYRYLFGGFINAMEPVVLK